MRRAIRVTVGRAVQAAGRIPALKRRLDQGAAQLLQADCAARSWQELDQLYTLCRRELNSRAQWRHGPARVLEVAKEGAEAIIRFAGIEGKTYCDLGCGTFHPFGISAAMYLNGAASTIAIDLHGTDAKRAAEALADLVADCICFPKRWNWTGMPEGDFIERCRRFDLEALEAGRLEAGLNNLPLSHIVSDIHQPLFDSTAVKESSIDIMTSRAVLEHFLDFETATRRLFAIMRPGGLAFHAIDLVDHRAYIDSGYHYWSFLAQENWSDGLVNRLRAPEILHAFEKAGFEILDCVRQRGEMPAGFAATIASRFKHLSLEELSVTGMLCVLRKP